jgi:hypothetical protein
MLMVKTILMLYHRVDRYRFSLTILGYFYLDHVLKYTVSFLRSPDQLRATRLGGDTSVIGRFASWMHV